MKAALGEPVSSLPADRDAAATASGWWLRSVVGTGDRRRRGRRGVVRAARARPRRPKRSATPSSSPSSTATCPSAGTVLDPCAAGNAFSVTELEKAATCPFRFFLKRGLGLRPVDDGERDKDVWLDPLTRGSELHDLYARSCAAAATPAVGRTRRRTAPG